MSLSESDASRANAEIHASFSLVVSVNREFGQNRREYRNDSLSKTGELRTRVGISAFGELRTRVGISAVGSQQRVGISAVGLRVSGGWITTD
jgi:hypothetical protein